MRTFCESNTGVTINLDTYKRNLKKITDFVGPSVKVMAVVKANAYGHGMVECAQTAVESGIPMLGVAFASEGIELRNAGIESPILVMAQESADNFQCMIDNHLTVTISSYDMLFHLKEALVSKNTFCRVHIKVDTGMGRGGVRVEDALELVDHAGKIKGVVVEGVYSHFSSADERDSTFSQKQITSFRTFIESLSNKRQLPPITHMCNSSATLNYPSAHFNLVRIGLLSYGLFPSPVSSTKLQVEPVLSWNSTITYIKDVPKGTPVSYGRTYITKRPSRVAVVPAGYAHGYRRHLSNKGYGIVKGKKVPIIGLICMDQTVFDITDAGDVLCGDTITLLGKNGSERISAEDLATTVGTICYEIVTGITSRVPRTFIKTT